MHLAVNILIAACPIRLIPQRAASPARRPGLDYGFCFFGIGRGNHTVPTSFCACDISFGARKVYATSVLKDHTRIHTNGRHVACTQLGFLVSCAFTVIAPPSSPAGNGRSTCMPCTEVRWALCMFRTCARERNFVIVHTLMLGQRHRGINIRQRLRNTLWC